MDASAHKPHNAPNQVLIAILLCFQMWRSLYVEQRGQSCTCHVLNFIARITLMYRATKFGDTALAVSTVILKLQSNRRKLHFESWFQMEMGPFLVVCHQWTFWKWHACPSLVSFFELFSDKNRLGECLIHRLSPSPSFFVSRADGVSEQAGHF